MEQIVSFKFTKTEIEYLNNLSEVVGISKKIIIDKVIHWANKNTDKLPKLDFSSDYDRNDNPWKVLNIRCDNKTHEILKQKSKEIGVTRYELLQALIKKVPELLQSGELYDYDSLNFQNFKRKD